MSELAMTGELLPSLLKAGGSAALAIGVLFLLYRKILSLGIFPRLKQWQAFVIICLLSVLVFTVTLVVLLKDAPAKPGPAAVVVDPPSMVDIRASKHPVQDREKWMASRAVLIHDIVFRNTASQARSAFVDSLSAEFTLSSGSSRFSWNSFVNMHEEQDGKWLAIERSATPFDVREGTVVAREVLHYAEDGLDWSGLVGRVLESTDRQVAINVKSSIDGKSVQTSCRLNLDHWRKVLKQLSVPDGRPPARLTMCCMNHPNSSKDPNCGPIIGGG